MPAQSSGDVRVCVRFRPQQDRELVKGGLPICKFDASHKNVTMNGSRKAAFTFDRVFNMETRQAEIYEDAAKPIVEDVLQGYNGTIFAYGQTSSGKTFTMEGPEHDGEKRGVIPRIVENIFNFIYMAPEVLEFKIRISYFEIYMERIRDLLADGNDNLQIHENRERGVYVRHATEVYAQSPEEVLDLMHQGAERRSTANTNMNDVSSRSHAIMLIEIEQRDTEKGGSKTGKLYMVDLAGSEKVSKTGADGEVLEEAKNINKSLSALGLVIMTLTDGNHKHHIPYRDSKLTRILQESLGGNARTCIIICCSPSSYNEQETLSSLQFGKRAKKIKNKAKVNIQFSVEELEKQLEVARREIARLSKRIVAYEKELKVWRSGGTVSEEDRATLMEDSTSTGSPQKQKAATVAAENTTTITDEEREEIYRRERELLDLMDDKDEEIHMLEKEIADLAKEKVTITKLAAENMHFQEQVKTLESIVEQIQDDNATFEVSIERLAAANEQFQQENARLKEENTQLGSNFEKKDTKLRKQMDQIADMLASLYSTKTGRRLPTRPGDDAVVIDPQIESNISRVRSQFETLQEEVTTAKTAQEKLESENQAQLNEIEELKKGLHAESLKSEQVERDQASIKAERDALAAKVGQAEVEKNALEAKLQDLILKMVEAEVHAEQRQKQSSLEEENLHDMKRVLEQEQNRIQAEHAQVVSELRSQVDTLKHENGSMLASKNGIEQELISIQADLENQIAHSKTLEAKLDIANQEKVKIEQKAMSSRSFRPETMEQVRKLQSQSAILKENIQRKTRELLNNMNKDDNAKDAQEHLVKRAEQSMEEARKFRDEVSSLKKQLHSKNERIHFMQDKNNMIQDKLDASMKELTQLRSEKKRNDRLRRNSVVKGVRGGNRDPNKPPNVSVRGGNKTSESTRDQSLMSKASYSADGRAEASNPEDIEYV
eukprot:m.335225 g.335225  ORF g.335225 m.335225 type:complete len:947 (-) comp17543_c0_seq1:112-2952(-)